MIVEPILTRSVVVGLRAFPPRTLTLEAGTVEVSSLLTPYLEGLG